MGEVVVRGNYLDPEGRPVVATQAPHPEDKNVIGGFPSARAWLCRWIMAAADVELFAYGHGGLQWDHGAARHRLNPGDWVVWTGERFAVVEARDFRRDYTPVDFTAATQEAPEDGEGDG